MNIIAAAAKCDLCEARFAERWASALKGNIRLSLSRIKLIADYGCNSDSDMEFRFRVRMSLRRVVHLRCRSIFVYSGSLSSAWCLGIDMSRGIAGMQSSVSSIVF